MVEVANGRSLVWGAEAVQALRERLGVGAARWAPCPAGPARTRAWALPAADA